MQKFSKKEAIKFGFNIAKSNFLFFLGVLVIAGLSGGIPEILDDFFGKDYPVAEILIALVAIPLNIIVAIGIIKVAINFVDNKKSSFSDIFSGYRLFFKYIAGAILYALIVLVGLVLFIVPGIIWGIKYQFYNYLIVDKNMGPIEAIKKSGEITQGSKMNLFLFAILLGLVNAAGALALGIGLLVTIPTTWVALAFVYRKLLIQGPVSSSEVPVETSTGANTEDKS